MSGSTQRAKEKLEIMLKRAYKDVVPYQPYFCELVITNNWPPEWAPDERPWVIKSTYDKALSGKESAK